MFDFTNAILNMSKDQLIRFSDSLAFKLWALHERTKDEEVKEGTKDEKVEEGTKDSKKRVKSPRRKYLLNETYLMSFFLVRRKEIDRSF